MRLIIRTDNLIFIARINLCIKYLAVVQIPVGYWLYNAFNKNYTADFGHFDDLIGEYKDTSGFTKQLLSDSCK